MLRKIFKNEIYLLIFTYLILVFIHIFFSRNMTLPIVLDDEFGYLANAAYFAGYNWSSIVSDIPYYSFGYSILLIPFFLIYDSPYTIYKAIILLNALIASSVVFMAYFVSGSISTHLNNNTRLLASFTVSLYTSYLVLSKLALAESLLVLLFWIILFCFLNLDKKNEDKKTVFIITGMIIGFIYIVHPRALGIILASLLVIFIAIIKRTIKYKQFLYYLSGLISVIIMQTAIKSYLVSNVWLNGAKSSTNTLSGSLSKLPDLLTLAGLEKALSTTIGQVYYLVSASYLLFFIGIVYVCILLYHSWKSNNNNLICLMFLLLSMVFSVIISVLSLYNGNRADHLLYGRYNEMILGPFILIGLIFLIEERSKNEQLRKRIFIYSILFYCGISVLTSSLIQTELFNRETYMVAISSIFPFREANWTIDINKVTVNILILVILFFLLIKIKPYLGMIFLAMVFLWISYDNMENYLFKASESKLHEVSGIVQEIQLSGNENNSIIYYLVDDWRLYLNRELYQFLLPESRIITTIPGDNQTPEGYIITDNKNFDQQLNGSKLLTYAPNGLYLWISPGRIQDSISEKGIQFLDKGLLDNSIDLTGSLPDEAYKSTITLSGGSQDIFIKKQLGNFERLFKYRVIKWINIFTHKIDIKITNSSEFTWPSNVNLGVFWVSCDNPAKWLEEYRVNIPEKLSPGESVVLEVPLETRRITPGNYQVKIGLVQEGVTWFFSKGDDLLSLNIKVD